jgi:hypothetical protein
MKRFGVVPAKLQLQPRLNAMIDQCSMKTHGSGNAKLSEYVNQSVIASAPDTRRCARQADPSDSSTLSQSTSSRQPASAVTSSGARANSAR